MSKQKPVKATKSFSSISMSINGAEFHAEGDPVEVSAKLSQFLEQTLAPIKKVKTLAERTFSKEGR